MTQNYLSMSTLDGKKRTEQWPSHYWVVLIEKKKTIYPHGIVV
jgi:hypothetical protein